MTEAVMVLIIVLATWLLYHYVCKVENEAIKEARCQCGHRPQDHYLDHWGGRHGLLFYPCSICHCDDYQP